MAHALRKIEIEQYLILVPKEFTIYLIISNLKLYLSGKYRVFFYCDQNDMHASEIHFFTTMMNLQLSLFLPP